MHSKDTKPMTATQTKTTAATTTTMTDGPSPPSPTPPAKRWDDTLSQLQYMDADKCILLSPSDAVTGASSKKDAHVFSPETPRGMLHRAFSVFLFDASTDELLLQKRASSKITFPNVWTNTCCSHPLHGMTPGEVDGPGDVEDGSVTGVKHAAVRKLEQELGIPIGQVKVRGLSKSRDGRRASLATFPMTMTFVVGSFPTTNLSFRRWFFGPRVGLSQVEEFKFLTRMHYWAADTVTHGKER